MAKASKKKTKAKRKAPLKKTGPKTPKGKARALANIKDHSWKKGSSGNPKGRPPGIRFLSEMMRDSLHEAAITIPRFAKKAKEFGLDPKKVTINEVLVKAHMVEVLDGNGTFMNQLWDRVEGKLMQKIENTIEGKMGITDAVAAIRTVKDSLKKKGTKKE